MKILRIILLLSLTTISLSGYTMVRDSIDVSLHFRGGASFSSESPEEAIGFSVEDLRVNISGDITKNIYFKYNHSLHSTTRNDGSLENLPSGINVVGIGARFGKFDIFTGRQYVAFGGFEYDAVPLEVYQFSEMIYYISCYHTGVGFSYKPKEGQQLLLQVTNAYPNRFNDMFGNVTLSIDKALAPLTYSANYNGTVIKNIYDIRYSFSYSRVGKGKENYFYAAGNRFRVSPKLSIYADIYYAEEDIDSKGRLSIFTVAADKNALSALDVSYLSYVARVNYDITPSVRLIAKASYDSASLTRDNGSLVAGNYSTTIGYVFGAEYTPFKESPFRVFLNYRGKETKFNEAANSLGFSNNHQNSVWLGVIYNMAII